LRAVFFLILICSFVTQAEPIWSNKKSGGDDYLVGTVHLGDHRFSQLPKKIKDAIDAVDVVVLELNLSALTPAEQQRISLTYGLLPQGKSLSTELSGQVYQQAADYLGSLGYSIQQFEQMKPWMLAVTLAQLSYVEQGLDVSKGVDQQILQYAKQKGKKIIGLETFEQQMQFFDNILKTDQGITGNDIVLDTLNELKQYADLPKQMMTAWLAGDMSTFENIYQQSLSTTSFDRAAEKILLTDRNKNWQEQLTPMLEKQKVLVAVGTLHYAGPYSLLNLLEQKFAQL